MRWEGHGESANIEDRRGMQRGGLAIGGAGGIGALVLAGIVYLITGDPNAALRIAQQGGQRNPVQEVGPPPNDQTKKFVATVLKFTEDVWTQKFREMGQQYQPPALVLFSQQVDSEGCGVAPSAVGPFYCPVSRKVFLDPSFFTELEQKLGGSKAEFSQAYVIAHEVGHHVQNLLGYNRQVKQFERREGKNASVRLELQADYMAGVWAYYGQKQFNFIESGDVEAAVTTAKAIGDDRIQKKSQGWASPESFTHGSAEARTRWFTEGLKTGDVGKFDTFFDSPLGELDPQLRGQ